MIAEVEESASWVRSRHVGELGGAVVESVRVVERMSRAAWLECREQLL